MILPTAALLIIENRKLLLAYRSNKQCFHLPGGKIDAGETATSALCREITEEMNVAIDEYELKYYRHITAPAYTTPAFANTRAGIKFQDHKTGTKICPLYFIHTICNLYFLQKRTFM